MVDASQIAIPNNEPGLRRPDEESKAFRLRLSDSQLLDLFAFLCVDLHILLKAFSTLNIQEQ